MAPPMTSLARAKPTRPTCSRRSTWPPRWRPTASGGSCRPEDPMSTALRVSRPLSPPTSSALRHIRGPSWVRVLLRTRLVPLGLLIVFAIVMLAVTADILTPFDPNEQHYNYVLKPPGPIFPLGTDDLGRDVYSRIAYGSRRSR